MNSIHMEIISDNLNFYWYLDNKRFQKRFMQQIENREKN